MAVNIAKRHIKLGENAQSSPSQKHEEEDLITISVKNLHLKTGWLNSAPPVCEGWKKEEERASEELEMGSWLSHTRYANDIADVSNDGQGSILEDDVKERWEREQIELKKQLILHDVGDWCPKISSSASQKLHHVGGVDISFIKGDNVNACAALVVLSFPDMKVVYVDMRMIKLTAPYIPGFLAFREAPFLADMVRHLTVTEPTLIPQVILVDGNGILHPREFGLASHFGVLIDIPCIGVAKNLFHVDGLERDDEFKEKVNAMNKAGDSFELRGSSGKCLGMAVRTTDSAPKPVFVSQGHGISLDTAVWVVNACSRYRIPEPTRQADLRSREHLRQKFPSST